MMFRVLTSILLFSIIKSSNPLENNTKPNISLLVINDNKVFVHLDDEGSWRVIKTSTNQYKLRSVMCRQLGLGPPTAPAYISDRNYNFYDNVIGATAFLCTGWESELSECTLQNTTQQRWLNYSSHFMQLNCLPAEAEEFSLVLQREYSYKDVGVPLIFYEGHWGPLCHKESRNDEFNGVHNVLCRQLGFDKATDFPYSHIGDSVFWPPVPLNVSCTGEEHTMTECRHSTTALSQQCGVLTGISCMSHYSTPSNDFNVAGGERTTLRYPPSSLPISPHFLTKAPDAATNIGLSVFILCLIIVVGGCLLYCIVVFCWKILKTPPPTASSNNLVSQTSGGTQRTFLSVSAQNRSHYITHMPPQYPVVPPVPAKDPELPTYEEAVENSNNVNNTTL